MMTFLSNCLGMGKDGLVIITQGLFNEGTPESQQELFCSRGKYVAVKEK